MPPGRSPRRRSTALRGRSIRCEEGGRMMQLLSGIGFLCLLVSSLGVGTRMLLLARRTRQAPEWLLGLSLVLLAGVGYPLMVATRAPGLLEPPTLGAVAVAGVLAIDVSVALLFAFVWRVFRPASGVARTAALLAFAALSLHFLWAARAELGRRVAREPDGPDTTPGDRAALAVRGCLRLECGRGALSPRPAAQAPGARPHRPAGVSPGGTLGDGEHRRRRGGPGERGLPLPRRRRVALGSRPSS